VLSADGVLSDPEPLVRFKGLSEWAADYLVVAAFDNYAEKYRYQEEVWNRIWENLHRAGIAPAIKRQEVHMFEGVKERGLAVATDPLTLLREIDIFSPFSEEQRQRLAETMQRVEFTADDTIFQQDDEGDSLFIVVEGVVKVTVKTSARKSSDIARIGAGGFFGEMALLTGEARTATVTAVTDTVLYEITKEHIAPLLEAQPELSDSLSEVLARRKQATETRMRRGTSKRRQKDDLYDKILSRIQSYFRLKK
ncbi:cyclic nucleotide-binding domain-containing protein, partial [bacterium]|nr:cyclic nucleotide-binding domain-containing protein [bacterium]